MKIFQVYSDKKVAFFTQFIVEFVTFFLFFLFFGNLINRSLVKYDFFNGNNIETVIKSKKYYSGIKEIYINAATGTDILGDIKNYEVLMQTGSSSLLPTEVIITRSLAEYSNMSVGSTIELKKIYSVNPEILYVKNIIQDSYLEINKDFLGKKGYIILPFDPEYEKNIESEYIYITQRKFSDLPNDLRANAKYLLTKKDVFKESFLIYSVIFCFFIAIFIFLFIVIRNNMKENIFMRIYNLFNLGQEKISNIFLLIKLIFLLYWLPIQLSILLTYKIQLFDKLIPETLLLETIFNTLVSLFLFLVEYINDMKQGRTFLI